MTLINWPDFRYSVRMLWKSPRFSLIVMITLAFAIGVNSAVFSIINGVLLRQLPYRDPQELVLFPFSSDNLVELRRQNHVFEHVAAFWSQPLDLTGRGEPEFLGNLAASADLFTLLGILPLHGRVFLHEEEQPGKDHVAILSYGLWRRRFGSDPKIVGQTISLNFEPYTIVGVMPSGFQFPRKGDFPEVWPIPGDIDIYTPTAFTPAQWNKRKSISIFAIARLKSGISLAQAQADMDGFSQWLHQHSHDNESDNRIVIETLQQRITGRMKLPLLVLLGAVGFVLLIGCANVANLMLARATARRREIAIRLALGAGRGRIISQLLMECMLLAVVSGALALLLAVWSVDLLRMVLPDNLPRTDEIGVDGKVFCFTLLLSLLAGILFGLVPALQASRPGLSDVLKEGGRNSGGIGRNRFRSLLVVSEVALAGVLLVGAGLMLRSFLRLTSVDPGLNTENVLTAAVRLPRSKYQGPQQAAFFRQLLARLRMVPGIQAASAAYPLPLSGEEEGISFVIEGERPSASGSWRFARPRCVGPDYFKALDIQLREGRDFSESDTMDAPGVLVINDVLARRYWPNQNPIGGHIALNCCDGKTTWREIIGIVKSVRHMSLSDELQPEIYFPFSQFPISDLKLVVRTKGDPLKFAAAVRNQVQAIDKDQPISNIHTMDELLARTISQPRFYLLLLALFAGVALLLATVGIYGVMSYLVTQRTNEIGIRMALGAQTREVVKLFVKHGLTLTLAGEAIGLATALGLTRLIKSFLFGVSTTDPLTFVFIGLVLIVTAFVACWAPARRAARVDPMVALRID